MATESTAAAGTPGAAQDAGQGSAADAGTAGEVPGEGEQPAEVGTEPGAGGASEPAAAAKGKQEPAAAVPAEPPAKKGPDVTGRLAHLSRQNREAQQALRQAEADKTAAQARVAEFDALLSQAKNKADIPGLLAKLNIPFEDIVNAYADVQEPDLTPEQVEAQATKKAIEDLRAKLEEQERVSGEERKAAAVRAENAARADAIAGIVQTIAKSADKNEICARLGDEAASEVWSTVLTAWDKLGRPQLMPGEYEEAVERAIEVVELRYEERGRKLAKTAKVNGTSNGHGAAPGGNANGAPKGSAAGNGDGKLSETDEALLSGLIEKQAPGASATRAKPRTINSSLGGSAPPKNPARGGMDPRDALREVLAEMPRQ